MSRQLGLIIIIWLFAGIANVTAETANAPADTAVAAVEAASDSADAGLSGLLVSGDDTPPPMFGDSEAPSMAGMLFQMLGSLVVIVLLIFGAAWVYRRINQPRLRGERNGRLVQVLGSTFLAPKKSVTLVHVGSRILVVGVSDADMSTLATLEESESDEILEQMVTSQSKSPAFSGMLEKVLGKRAS